MGTSEYKNICIIVDNFIERINDSIKEKVDKLSDMGATEKSVTYQDIYDIAISERLLLAIKIKKELC